MFDQKCSWQILWHSNKMSITGNIVKIPKENTVNLWLSMAMNLMAGLISLTKMTCCLLLSCLWWPTWPQPHPPKLLPIQVSPARAQDFWKILCKSSLSKFDKKSPVAAGALRLNEFDTGHQAAFRACLVLDYLINKQNIQITIGVVGSGENCHSLFQRWRTFAQTTFQRAQWEREANWETLSSLHSPEPTGLK